MRGGQIDVLVKVLVLTNLFHFAISSTKSKLKWQKMSLDRF